MLTFEDFILESKAEEYEFHPAKYKSASAKGYEFAGHTTVDGKKGANILKHPKTGKFFASGGASEAITPRTTFHDSAKEACDKYHKKG